MQNDAYEIEFHWAEPQNTNHGQIGFCILRFVVFVFVDFKTHRSWAHCGKTGYFREVALGAQ